MARNSSNWLPIIALLDGIIAVILSFIAYTLRVKSENVYNNNGICSYPLTNASLYGIWAALVLLLGQITISVVMRCYCCNGGRRYSSKCLAITSIILFISSWVSSVITAIGLIHTSVYNNHGFLTRNHSISNNDKSCYVHGEALFLGAAIWCVITTVLGGISYAFWARSDANTPNNNVVSSNNNNDGIAMGGPYSLLAFFARATWL